MFNKEFGSNNFKTTYKGVIIYTLFLLLYVAIESIGAFIFEVHLGYVSVSLTTILVAHTCVLEHFIARWIIYKYKVENIAVFRSLSIISGIIIFIAFILIRTTTNIVYDTYIYEKPETTIIDVVENREDELYLLSENNFVELVVKFITEPKKINVARRGVNIETTSVGENVFFFMYILVLAAFPTGNFNFRKGIYYDGKLIKFEKMYLVSNTKIIAKDLMSNIDKGSIQILEDRMTENKQVTSNKNLHLYIVYYTNNRVENKFLFNVFKRSFNKMHGNLNIPPEASFYYTSDESISDYIVNLKTFDINN